MLRQLRVTYGEDENASSLPETTTTIQSSFPDLHPSKPLPILIRATDGKSKENRKEKVKLSTIVSSDALDGFFVRYAEVCKSGMTGLKKRDRSKRKEKLKAKKKKGSVAAGEEIKK